MVVLLVVLMFYKEEEVIFFFPFFFFFFFFFFLSFIPLPFLTFFQKGHIMISVEPKHEGFAKNQNEGILSCFFSQVGKLTVTEVMGSNKALDYAIVDCFMGAYLCFLNGLSLIFYCPSFFLSFFPSFLFAPFFFFFFFFFLTPYCRIRNDRK